jgi:3-oxoacyl-[acyl-carrier protein] reductase
MALRLAPKKPHIALIDMNADTLAEAKKLIEDAGASASTWVCNVAKEDEVDETFAQIAAQAGRLDAVVNNAGITRDSLFLKVKEGVVEKRMSFEHWQQVIDVNLTGTFLCGRAAATEMVKAGNGGCIINISSISRHGNMGQTNYTATKAGVAAMAVTWAKELARQGIRCAAIAPGYIGTEMVLTMKPEALEKIAAGIPAKRLGQPDEIAQTVEFILENDYVNGRVIEVDGGLRV